MPLRPRKLDSSLLSDCKKGETFPFSIGLRSIFNYEIPSFPSLSLPLIPSTSFSDILDRDLASLSRSWKWLFWGYLLIVAFLVARGADDMCSVLTEHLVNAENWDYLSELNRGLIENDQFNLFQDLLASNCTHLSNVSKSFDEVSPQTL